MAVNLSAPREVIQELRAQGETAESILANVERFTTAMQFKTLPGRKAQKERQEAPGIRGGGAPGTKAEARAMVKELVQSFERTAGISRLSPEEQRRRVRELIAHVQEVNAAVPGKVAILFKSGGPFIYPTSTTGEYASLVAAGSAGKEVWRIGWGPDRHPTYNLVTITPERVIDEHPVQSSWVKVFYLLREVS